jgi:hypothetical protein
MFSVTGNRERIALTLPKNAKDALAAWLSRRGTDEPDAPLFINLAHNSSGTSWLVQRITAASRPSSNFAAMISAAAIEDAEGDARLAELRFFQKIGEALAADDSIVTPTQRIPT